MTNGKYYHAQTFHFMLGSIYLRIALPLIKESIALFEQLGADGHLKRAQAALNALEPR